MAKISALVPCDGWVEEQAVGLCWAGYQAAALARGECVCWGQREPCVTTITCPGSVHETSCCSSRGLVSLA